MKNKFILIATLSALVLTGCDSLSSIINISDANKQTETPANEENSTSETNNEGQTSNTETNAEGQPTNTETTTEGQQTITPEVTLTDEVKEYYKNISSTATGDTLKTQLYNLIKGHTKYDYDNAEIAMRTTDRNWEKSPDPNDENPYMNLLYTVDNDAKASKWNTYHGSGGISDYNNAHWNKEHIWAKSNGFNKEGCDAYADLHHLRASDTKNNGSRSSFAFNNNSGTYVEDFNGDKSGKLGGSPKTYEPLDRDKGDVARALFYMATRYSTGDGSTGTKLTLTNGTDSSGGKWGYVNTLLAWHTQDPPDAWEINRNSLVQSFQDNRNPYIDHPEWAQKVFG